MKNVSAKPDTLRRAVAGAVLTLPADCIPLLAEARTDKGDALAAARIAGIMAGKRTSDIIPLCHPLPIHEVDVAFELRDTEVVITAHAETIGPTGVEMEALTAASVAGLTLYDMLKPHAGTNLSLDAIQLLGKQGGKSDHRRQTDQTLAAAILVVSSPATDEAVAESVRQRLTAAGMRIQPPLDVADDSDAIADAMRRQLADDADLVFTLGGIGAAESGHATRAVAALLDRPLPGLMETARAFGQRRAPYAMLADGAAGWAGTALLATLPGSSADADSYLDALLPGLIRALAD
ncbi:cyclic pyranopterin monophosphate synthase MoaC [Salinisphaera sp. P385]|uniref:Molybdenum cofactor biosynthesis protein B n=1 Tax=Spectribacter acetivorans TaxID=3075603 RepID=A0ABU3B6F9_9GAMM|nr:cyclic pyranopterin monophosphate synthase MoaC [Salinisphaera sp. P385]MDT0617715.1 cyclic pyranopterin monophosphate synthase MoaC [Salinisphaera sp. P385]